MSNDGHPFGSDYPSEPPTYPAASPARPGSGGNVGLPSPVLPPKTAAYPTSSYQLAQPYAPAPYGPPPVPYGMPYAAPINPYGRPPAPGIALTLVITLFFGLFGLIPAFVHSEEAKRNGYSPSKYWATFGITLGAQFLLAMIFFLFVIFGIALLN